MQKLNREADIFALEIQARAKLATNFCPICLPKAIPRVDVSRSPVGDSLTESLLYQGRIGSKQKPTQLVQDPGSTRRAAHLGGQDDPMVRVVGEKLAAFGNKTVRIAIIGLGGGRHLGTLSRCQKTFVLCKVKAKVRQCDN